jgi:hypothetical protein
MILTKSKIYEINLFISEISDKKFRNVYTGYLSFLDNGMASASEKGYEKLVYFFISRGANDWVWGLCSSAKGGYKKIVDFFVSKRIVNWFVAGHSSAEESHENLTQFFCAKNYDSYYNYYKGILQKNLKRN